MAIRMAAAFGTTPEFWFEATKKVGKDKPKPLFKAG
jgi:plasmid maintenance system antidote protein VapI